MAVLQSSAPNLADSLSLAMVAASDVPLLLLDGDLAVIAASHSFCLAFNVESNTIRGSLMFELGSGEWNLPRLRSLLTATATATGQIAIDGYEIDLKSSAPAPRRLVVKAQKLIYADADATRLLVTVSDVTDARLAEKVKDDLLREKAVLLQEVQHRVANSLQIIASVLMQSARSVQSEETRVHLQDARNRVMSIATVQRQLASSNATEVALLPYFTQLCQSLGASMIRNHERQTIEVCVDDSIVGADISVGLGLIVTELVINALKHAFPEERPGKILVNYRSNAADWTLSVGDNGVGMPTGVLAAKPGLGTSIVEALARQMKAQVNVAAANPGTSISISRTQVTGLDLNATSSGRAI
jgi:two-component sensor histidine kinase